MPEFAGLACPRTPARDVELWPGSERVGKGCGALALRRSGNGSRGV